MDEREETEEDKGILPQSSADMPFLLKLNEIIKKLHTFLKHHIFFFKFK